MKKVVERSKNKQCSRNPVPTFHPHVEKHRGQHLSSRSRPVTSVLAGFRRHPHSSGETTFDYGTIGQERKAAKPTRNNGGLPGESRNRVGLTEQTTRRLSTSFSGGSVPTATRLSPAFGRPQGIADRAYEAGCPFAHGGGSGVSGAGGILREDLKKGHHHDRSTHTGRPPTAAS